MGLPFGLKILFMKWELVSNHRTTLQEYHLVDNNECKVVLKYNPLHQSARVSCGNHQRLFFIESAGSLTAKMIFKNEYGMEIGNLHHDKWHINEGSVTIDSKTFHYRIQSTPSTALLIYNDESHQPFINCELQTNKGNAAINYIADYSPIDNSWLLLGLCWYLFLPVVKEKRAEFAA